MSRIETGCLGPMNPPNHHQAINSAGDFPPFSSGAVNRFTPLAREDEETPGDSFCYELLQSEPGLPPNELERPAIPAVEILIAWGRNILTACVLTPPRTYVVGESDNQRTVDFLLPKEKLPAPQIPIVIGDGKSIAVVLPAGATGSVEMNGQPPMSLDEARAQAQPCSELAGAQQLPLPLDASAKVEVNGFVFTVTATVAGQPIQKGFAANFDWSVAMYFGLSFATFGGLLAALAFFVPPLGLSDESELDKDRLLLIQQYLQASADREQDEPEVELIEATTDNEAGGTGTKAAGEEGAMGKESSKATNKRYAVKGPADNPDPHLAKQAALREARDFGMIGLLNAGASGDPNAPTAPWGQETSSGADAMSAQGNMWGDEIGDAFGSGGLGLSGIGEGGGGRGEGIGLGNIGGLGHGAGTGTGQGFGSGHGRLGGSYKTRAPKVRMGATSVNGRLPPQVIQRIVRQNFGRFRMCYEQGLARNPNLEGRVGVRFVIGRDGAVSNVGNGGSDIPDSGVVSCVISAFYGLSFPQPEGGIVRVTYPIMFSPG
ncbi:MAG: AgmX/PglI C-terminal domain-containing protein [Polyangiaceae bacterium]|nr:AgmX/PglI C-terminal domain-containing protein [Polyangiaceae bacterium]